jgi:hypothetical protein
MSLIDRFRRQPDNDGSDKPERVPEPKDLRLRGQIRQDDIFPTRTDDEQ